MYYYNYLQHHGVKGMKWGVRRERESSKSQKSPKTPKVAKTEFGKKIDSSKGLKATTRVLKTIGQTAAAYFAPSVAGGLFIGASLATAGAIPIATLAGVSLGSSVLGLAGAATSLVANGKKFVDDMRLVEQNQAKNNSGKH